MDGGLVVNSGFERAAAGGTFPEAWAAAYGVGVEAEVAVDTEVVHSGLHAIRISNRSARKAFVYAAVGALPIPVDPETTYVLRFYARGRGAGACYACVAFDRGGERRLMLPAGSFAWRAFACEFTVPKPCASVSIRFASDDVTEAFWIDDVTIERAPHQRANLREKRYPKEFPGVFPRTQGRIPKHLAVFDATHETDEARRAIAVLQGLVNRRAPRLYLINRTNPEGFDALWLSYMQEKGYTGAEEPVSSVSDLLARYRGEVRGAILYDDALPGSVQAACMLAGLSDALPLSAETAAAWGLPALMDLRGRWTRNVDAYRFVYDNYWDRMNHHVLAWTHPTASSSCTRDYLAEFNVFAFWLSSHADNEPGAEPAAEEEFINELLANTPANIPVMGWPMCGDNKGVAEYEGVRWLSEYGKFVPGTEFCSNLSIHTAIHPSDRLFRRRPAAPSVPFDPRNLYVSVNVLDSGDALWYWQFHQRNIWSDPARGSVPIGWCMNITLPEMLPLVLQWYCEQASANDTFFAGVSGLGYMNTQVFASRFQERDRERIWRAYVKRTERYCRKLDIHGIELYNGSWGEASPPNPEVFCRFTRGMRGLDFILADLGRHENVSADTANYLLDGTSVFHTLTRFEVWSSSAEVKRNDRGAANAWLSKEIQSHAPAQRPGFLSAMAISWYYYPSWFQALEKELPEGYVLAGPAEMARLYRDAARSRRSQTCASTRAR